MLLDLAKLEFRISMMKLLDTATGGQGLSKSIGGVVSGFFSGPTGMPVSETGADILARKANGAAYVQGVQAFANGGTFTNSVVDSPTLFKFAKGTGLMGDGLFNFSDINIKSFWVYINIYRFSTS